MTRKWAHCFTEWPATARKPFAACISLRTFDKTWRAALQMLLLWQSHNSLIQLLVASQSKVLSHLCQSFPLQAFGLGRSCLVTAGFRRRPMVVKPTLTFRSGKKIVYGTLPASKSCHWCNATKEEKCASTFHSIWINLSGVVRGCKFKINIYLNLPNLV